MPCHFHVPETVADALRISRELQGAACFIAGGTEVNNLKASQAQEHLVWLGRLGLDRITRQEAGVSIGAMATLQEILESQVVHPAIHQAASNHTNRNIRNVATLGG
ncbi:MAG TPA: FAD binding domain-containing protein, partial [Thermoanaerobaculaceae bacterium]|nr:FAD binding domain-containing protein [Thermoanaerobaculaceae bacterium]